jgi:amino acid adenylation domain-containing protein
VSRSDGGRHPAENQRDGRPAAPLSYPQLGLYLAHQTVADVSSLTINSMYLNAGRLDPGQLTAALAAMADRHSVLRTTLTEGDAEPRQAVQATAVPEVTVADVRDEAAIKELLQARFDLFGGPLWRTALLHCPDGADMALLAAHHLVFDEASKGLWRHELAQHLAGRQQALVKPPIQYADFAAWQRERFAGPGAGHLLDFWAARLGGPALTVLPGRPDRPGAARYAALSLPIGHRQAAALLGAARTAGATPFAAAAAAVAAAVAGHLGRDQVTLGTIVSGRQLAETQPLLGCFTDIGLLPLSVADASEPAELVQRASAAVRDMLGPMEAPFNWLAELLGPPSRQPGRLPFTDVGVQLHHAQAGPHRPELTHARLEAPGETGGRTPFGLEFSLTLLPDGELLGELLYRADLYTERQVSALAEAFTAACAFTPGRSRTATTASAPEPAQATSPGAARRLPAATVLDAIHEQAELAPDAVAVRYRDQSLTYGQLETAAGTIAAALRGTAAQDAGASEVRIGVVVRPDLYVLPVLLGLFRTGATYVPLDEGLPAARMAAMVHDAGIRHVLVFGVDQAPPPPGVQLIQVADLVNPPAAAPATGPANDPVTEPGRAAYVMFTSGSTGRPKGVVIEHGALLATLAAMRPEIGLAPGHQMLSLTTASFDISLVELLLPLISGATVVHAPSGTARDGDGLVAMIAGAGITHVQATPAGWRVIVAADPDCTVQVEALCGGDTLPSDLAEELRRRASRVWNLYGPTEATIWASAQRVDLLPAGPVPIGRPLANARLHVLDDAGFPRSAGVPGELWIGGTGLARGYLDGGQTAERFTEHPQLGRLYRTGDRARQRPDGGFEFLGRVDTQLKVNGHRVEVTEIESAVRQFPGVLDCVIVPETMPGGSVRLLARLVLTSPAAAPPDPRELVSRLVQTLPSYMIPAIFQVIAELPLTPNGKVDRIAAAGLTAPVLGGLAAGESAETVDDADTVDKAVLLAARETLGGHAINLDDNFFENGGDSLLMLRLVSLIEHRCGCRLAIRTVMTAESVRRIADAVRGAQSC